MQSHVESEVNLEFFNTSPKNITLEVSFKWKKFKEGDLLIGSYAPSRNNGRKEIGKVHWQRAEEPVWFSVLFILQRVN